MTTSDDAVLNRRATDRLPSVTKPRRSATPKIPRANTDRRAAPKQRIPLTDDPEYPSPETDLFGGAIAPLCLQMVELTVILGLLIVRFLP